MEQCKFCLGEKLVKNGVVKGRQRWRCAHCGRNPREGDKREKYDNALRRQALALYLNSTGIRSIGRALKVPHQSVSNWVENAGKIVEREIQNLHMTPRNISILEMDELFTYVQKKSAKCEYGWLLIGTEMKLLRLTSAAGHGKTRGNSTGLFTGIPST